MSIIRAVYTKEQRTRLYRRIRELKKEGKTQAEIFQGLADEGFTLASGAPLTQNATSALIWRAKIRRSRPAGRRKPRGASGARRMSPAVGMGSTRATASGKKPQMPDTALAILTDPGLSEEKKLALLTAYYS